MTLSEAHWKVKMAKGKRPYKITKERSSKAGKVVGTSKTRAKALSSVRARYAGSKGK